LPALRVSTSWTVSVSREVGRRSARKSVAVLSPIRSIALATDLRRGVRLKGATATAKVTGGIRAMIRARELGAFTVVGTVATACNSPSSLRLFRWVNAARRERGGLLCLVRRQFRRACALVVSDRALQHSAGPVSFRGFVVVELLAQRGVLRAALRWSALDFRVALFAVIVLLAAVQLLASKHWACAFEQADRGVPVRG